MATCSSYQQPQSCCGTSDPQTSAVLVSGQAALLILTGLVYTPGGCQLIGKAGPTRLCPTWLSSSRRSAGACPHGCSAGQHQSVLHYATDVQTSVHVASANAVLGKASYVG